MMDMAEFNWKSMEDEFGATELANAGRDVVMRCWNRDRHSGELVGPPTLLRIPDSFIQKSISGEISVSHRDDRG